jgi:hypothetical protein
MKFQGATRATGKPIGGIRMVVAIACALGITAEAGAQAPASAPLPGLNSKEALADKIWTLRAGLNVAALQCQFSPFLATVPTYNALLRQHSDELADSFKVMTGYFVRMRGPKIGQRAFDTYATRTNQSWATFDAQYSFCNAAAMVGRQALGVPKGKFGAFAETELAKLRESLIYVPIVPAASSPKLEWAHVPNIASCDKRGRCSW